MKYLSESLYSGAIISVFEKPIPQRQDNTNVQFMYNYVYRTVLTRPHGKTMTNAEPTIITLSSAPQARKKLRFELVSAHPNLSFERF